MKICWCKRFDKYHVCRDDKLKKKKKLITPPPGLPAYNNMKEYEHIEQTTVRKYILAPKAIVTNKKLLKKYLGALAL